MGRWSAERNADTLLRYLSPEIEWEFVGIDEHWREGIKVVFRKRSESKQCHEASEGRNASDLRSPIAT